MAFNVTPPYGFQTGYQYTPPTNFVPPAQQNTQGISPSSRMVSNRDEANAVPADFTGALMVFPDVRGNRVYLKRWNYQTGAADFLEFVPATHVQEQNYATMEHINELRKEIELLKGAKVNDTEE